MNTQNENPLVSIIVVTYNSSQYVLETLESAKAQTYKNIELVITDDCSTDNTIDLCNEWIGKNKSYFIRTKIIKAKTNKGIPANCNQGLSQSSGDWIKFIAGDDILTENCVNDYIDFINGNRNIKIIHSSFISFISDNGVKSKIKERSFLNHPIAIDTVTPKQQHQILLKACFINSPTIFISKEIFNNLGNFDESIHYVEDWPMWLRITKSNYMIYFLEKVTVYYRMHEQSICNEGLNGKLFNSHYKRERPVYLKYIFPNIGIHHRFFLNYGYYLWTIFDRLNLNKKKRLNFLMYKTFLTPYSIYHRTRNILNNYIFDIDREVKRYE